MKVQREHAGLPVINRWKRPIAVVSCLATLSGFIVMGVLGPLRQYSDMRDTISTVRSLGGSLTYGEHTDTFFGRQWFSNQNDGWRRKFHMPNKLCVHSTQVFGTSIVDRPAVSFSAKNLSQLKFLSGLRYVELTGQNFGDDTILALTSLPDLEYLDLSCTRISDAGLRDIGRLRDLQGLNLEQTGVTSKGLAFLRRLPFLRAISLANCSNVDDDSMLELTKCKALEEVDLRNAGVTVSGLETLLLSSPKLRMISVGSFDRDHLEEVQKRFPRVAILPSS